MEGAEKLANDHWSYVEQVITIGNKTEWDKSAKNILNVIKFHYISAFIHGFKHGVEELQKNGNIN